MTQAFLYGILPLISGKSHFDNLHSINCKKGKLRVTLGRKATCPEQGRKAASKDRGAAN